MKLACLLLAFLMDDPARVREDNTRLAASGAVEIAATPIEDLDDNGVIQISDDNVTLDFKGQVLQGAPAGRAPDTFRGYGLRITGKHVTIRNATIRGFKAAIYATGADGLLIEDCDFSGNFAQRLRSTPEAEDQSDWLWPHDNEDNEWLRNYGAAVYVERARDVTIRRCVARHGQNGALLHRVEGARVYDNDFSFLSGWGIGLFRSSRNLVVRNNCDFCMRGYSHGVYSRGQDSAGILLFEQSCENVIAYNSATHSGDGFFGFGGKAALEGPEAKAGAGSNANLLYGNDFSDSAANAIEMTFSFENVYAKNILNGGNYGVWGGYCARSRIIDNEIGENLIAGVAIEHGSEWTITRNRFHNNRRGVQLWWDDDAELLRKPWAQANPTLSGGYEIYQNRFTDDQVGIELRGTKDVFLLGNTFENVPTEIDADTESSHLPSDCPVVRGIDEERLENLPGERQAVGLRKALRGRENTIMSEWGPYDWGSPLLHYVGAADGGHQYRVLGAERVSAATATGLPVTVNITGGDRITVRPAEPGAIGVYTLKVKAGGRELGASRLLCDLRWAIRAFAYQTDPRAKPEQWREESAAGVEFTASTLDLRYGAKGPSELPMASEALRSAKLPQDRFGTIAVCEAKLPKGRWALDVTSDDGVRVRINDRIVYEDWTHHAPRAATVPIDVVDDSRAALRIEVEHFELDGYAVLSAKLRQADVVEGG